MRTFLDCIPCLIRQALASVRFATHDQMVHERVLRDVVRAASEMDFRRPPPEMGQRIHRMIRQNTGEDDPYHKVKQRFNRLALGLYPDLRKRVEDSANPLETAVQLAIAGNIIDFGVNSHLTEAQVHAAISQSLSAPFHNEVKEFAGAVSGANEILYLADNAGEIVFDRLLIEQMPTEKVTVVVRGSPVINDATLEDAEAVGLTRLVEVIDNGSDAPGTILDDCSEAFRARFDKADLIIAKGQGNYETLSEVHKDIYFVLKIKCPVLARDLGCHESCLVLRRSAFPMAPAGRGCVLALT
jgi:uncharacterized protein with ATP-grasp and redox domains